MGLHLHGILILHTYKFGSGERSFDNLSLAVPELDWIGLEPSTLAPGYSPEPLTETEVTILENLLKPGPVAEDRKWRDRITSMLSDGTTRDIEQCLDYNNLEEYLYERIPKMGGFNKYAGMDQVDSSDDKIEDSSCKRTCSTFGSGREDDVFLAKQENLPSLAKNTNGEVSKETEPEKLASNDDTKKESRNAMKRKSDIISQDPASPVSRDGAMVSGSSVPKQEAELKRPSKKKKRTLLEAEDGKHSNNTRKLENGLIIKDLSAGNQYAKVASNGSKVSISYTARLQDGNFLHSNAGGKPCKFKLGGDKVISGWNLGIDGMHIGEKRRLTIPPSLRENGRTPVGETPENLIIIYDVELVKVR